MQTPNIFQKYNWQWALTGHSYWQWALTGHSSLASLGTFYEAVQIEQILATGRSVTYFETPKGVLFVAWDKPRANS